MAKNNAQIMITVLENQKKDLVYEINQKIERLSIDLKYESPYLSEDYFHLRANVIVQNILSEQIISLSRQIQHLAQTSFPEVEPKK